MDRHPGGLPRDQPARRRQRCGRERRAGGHCRHGGVPRGGRRRPARCSSSRLAATRRPSRMRRSCPGRARSPTAPPTPGTTSWPTASTSPRRPPSARSRTRWRSTRRRPVAAPGASTPRREPASTSSRRTTSSSCSPRRRSRATSSSRCIDTAAPRAPPSGAGDDAQPEDLILIARGTRLVQQNNPQSVGPSTDSPAVPRSGIWARGDILLNVGDDVEAPVLTEIVAGSTITIFGDYLNADPGFGTTMNFGGRVGGVFDLSAPPVSTIRTWIFGHTDADVFNFLETFLGAPTRVYGSQSQTTGTADGTDFFLADRIQTMNVAAGHTLTFNGQADRRQRTSSSRPGTEGAERNYVVNVLDTGVGGDDGLEIRGADGSDDIFLLRRIVAITNPNETATNPAFVILLHGDLALLRDAIAGNETSTNMQRVNYDVGIDGFLQVQELGGDDFFASDDTSAEALVFGGDGNDTFQIGQLFGLPRDTTTISPPGDVFSPPAVQTTRGYLSRGQQRADADRRRRRRRRLHGVQQPGQPDDARRAPATTASPCGRSPRSHRARRTSSRRRSPSPAARGTTAPRHRHRAGRRHGGRWPAGRRRRQRHQGRHHLREHRAARARRHGGRRRAVRPVDAGHRDHDGSSAASAATRSTSPAT